MQTEISPATQSPFRLSPNNHPADILDGAASVARFLADMAPNLTEQGGGCGLSERGAMGLMLIMDALERTIDTAIAKL
jgi:hypothetical protein